MREVRMTFGEHLEELRKRMIWGLFWLAIGTVVCLVFGSDFMAITLRPHVKASQGAMNRRHHVLITQEVRRLGDLQASSGPWDLLFTAAIQRAVESERVERLEGHVEKFVKGLNSVLPSLPQQEVAALGHAIEELATRLFSEQAEDAASEAIPFEARDYVEKFKQVREVLGEIAHRLEPNRLQKLLGLGSSFENVLEPVDEFIAFLQKRREALIASYGAISSPSQLRSTVESQLEDKQTTLAAVEKAYKAIADRAEQILKQEPEDVVLLNYLEGFTNFFKVGLIFGLFLSLPLILWELWKFVGAGLYEHEQRYVLVFFPFSLALFVSGAVFGYFWMVPIGLEFLASWGAEYAALNFALGPYINLFFTLTILLGLVFQTPLVMIFLYQIGLVSPAGFARVRKYTLFGAVIFSTMVTPPDPLSWSMMAGPIMLLYELGIRICQFMERSRARGSSAS